MTTALMSIGLLGLSASSILLTRVGKVADSTGAAVSFASGDNPYTDERIRGELGWRPPTQARAAIGRTVAWFLENEKPGH